MISILFFGVSNFILEQKIDEHHNENLVETYNQSYIKQLQKYVTERRVSVKETDKLDEWIRNNKIIYIQIMKNGEWIYASDFEMDEIRSDDYDILPYSSDNLYNVTFEDGEAQVYIMGMYSYHTYMFALILDIIASFIIFFILIMFGIRRKIRYVNELGRDIEILEGGNLDYEVQVKGKDELTELARGLNAMKISFHNQIKEVENLTKTNQVMITEISHDLRTPLTSVLLYAEILKSGKYEDEESKLKYLDKMIKKIHHIKELSDGMLAYYAHVVEERYVPAQFCSVYSAIYDELFDMFQYLEEHGLKIKASLQWQPGQIYIYEKYLVRIFDNISSNILKYADRQAPVKIWDEYGVDEMCITFENTCIKDRKSKDSYSIGIRNVKTMLKEIDGRCDVVKDAKMFRICIRFRYREAGSTKTA